MPEMPKIAGKKWKFDSKFIGKKSIGKYADVYVYEN